MQRLSPTSGATWTPIRVPLAIKQDVLELDVAMDHVVHVEVLECAQHLRRAEGSDLRREAAASRDVRLEVAAGADLEHEQQLVVWPLAIRRWQFHPL